MSEFFGRAPGIETEKPSSDLDSLLSNLREDYLRTRYDKAAADKIDAVRIRLTKLLESEPELSYQSEIDDKKEANIKDLILGNNADSDPEKIAEKIIEHLKK